MVTGKVRATPESCVDSNMGYPHLIFMKFFFYRNLANFADYEEGQTCDSTTNLQFAEVQLFH